MNRRGFLQTLGLLTLGGISDPRRLVRQPMPGKASQRSPNILVVLFDALSAANMSLYGYPRPTTPNVERFAERAIVYHRHYAAGNFTTPGTASLLTGVYPWKHRAIHVYGQILSQFERQNMFTLFQGSGYRRIGYTHNDLAEILLYQLREAIDEFLRADELALFYDKPLSEGPLFQDRNAAFTAERTSLRGEEQIPAVLFGAGIQKVWRTWRKNRVLAELMHEFPLGVPTLPGAALMFLLEDGIDYVVRMAAEAERPYLAYFHFYPPHGPFHTRREFVGRFEGGWQPAPKPAHFFAPGVDETMLQRERREYDEYIAYMDAEFGRLVDDLEATGSLDNTVLIFTSDHGQMFERGILGHTTETLFEPVIRIPLLISLPGQETRIDIDTPTSCVDVAPTMGAIADLDPMPWFEGTVLPGIGSADRLADQDAIFALEAKTNNRVRPLERGSLAMIKGDHKMIHYFGYDAIPREFELYDLSQDPEELVDLYSEESHRAQTLRRQLLMELDQINAPYR